MNVLVYNFWGIYIYIFPLEVFIEIESIFYKEFTDSTLGDAANCFSKVIIIYLHSHQTHRKVVVASTFNVKTLF